MSKGFSIGFCAGDVQAMAKHGDISEIFQEKKLAEEVIETAERRFSADIGVSWDVLEVHAGEVEKYFLETLGECSNNRLIKLAGMRWTDKDAFEMSLEDVLCNKTDKQLKALRGKNKLIDKHIKESSSERPKATEA